MPEQDRQELILMFKYLLECGAITQDEYIRAKKMAEE